MNHEKIGKINIISQGLFFAILFLCTYHFLIDKNKVGWHFDFFSIIGTEITIIGFIYTLIQIKSLKTESKIIKETTKQTKEKINDFNNFAEIAKGIKLIQEIQGYSRGKKHEAGVMRLQELKIIIIQTKSLNLSSFEKYNMQERITDLNQLIGSMEKEIANNGKTLISELVNSKLEIILDTLANIQSDTLQGS